MKTFLLGIIILSTCSLSLIADDNIRYFGGESETKANVAKSAIYVAPVVITEEIFKANDTQEYEIAVKKENQKLVDSKKVAPEFLDLTNGHTYGGVSEGELTF